MTYKFKELNIALVYENEYYDKSVEVMNHITKLGHNTDNKLEADLSKYNCVISIFPQIKQTHREILKKLCDQTIIHIALADSHNDIPVWYKEFVPYSINMTKTADCIESIYAISTTLVEIDQ